MTSTAAARIGAVLAAGALLLLAGCGTRQALRVSETRSMMGTSVTITVYDRSRAAAERALAQAYARMAEIEDIASSYDEASELSRLNQAAYLASPSEELIEMIRISHTVYNQSGGAFDVTIGALLDLWRYDAAADTQFWDLSTEQQLPRIEEARQSVGMEHIQAGEATPPSLTLDPGTIVDLGGVAKGYAVDEAIETLQAAGIESGLVNAGGDLRVYGGKPDGSVWEIALRNPQDPDDYLAWFHLSDGAVVTSGNYERFFDPSADVGHILDPHSGYSSLASSSATVFAPTCAEADALATALFVLGPDSGMALAERLPEIEALIVAFDDPTDVRRSSGIARFERPSGD